MYFNVAFVNLNENKQNLQIKFESYSYVPYKTVWLSSCDSDRIPLLQEDLDIPLSLSLSLSLISLCPQIYNSSREACAMDFKNSNKEDRLKVL